MRLLPIVLLALVAPACASPQQPRPSSEMTPPAVRTLVYGQDIRSRPELDYARARASRWPDVMRFTVDEGPRIEGNSVVIHGTLENPLDHDLPLIILPMGRGSGPLFLELRVDTHVTFHVPGPGEPPLRPPAPPPPVEIVIPARSRVRFVGAADLSRYDWQGTPEVTLAWTFLHWNEPKPVGTLRFMLPAR